MVQYVVLGLVAVTALIVLINLLKGLIRGFKKSIGSLVAIIVSAIVAFIVTPIICNPSSGLVAYISSALKGILSPELTDILFGVQSVADVLNYYIALVLAPFVFLALYIVLSIVLAIVASIIVRIILKKKKEKGVAHRLGGLGIGVVCGILVSAIMLTPIVGILGIASNVGKSGAADMLSDAEIAGETLPDMLEELSGDEVFNIYRVVCGSIFNSLTTTSFEGTPTTLENELTALVDIVSNFSALSSGEEMGQEQIDAMNAVVDDLDKSPLVKHAAAGLVSEMASSWVAGETFLGIDKIDAGEMLDPVINSLLEVLATTDKANIVADMRTLTGILSIFVKHNLLGNTGDVSELINTLGKGGVVGELIKEINKNKRMAGISDSITQLSISALTSSIGIPKSHSERYDQLMNDTAKILNESKYMNYDVRYEYVDTHLISTLDKYGVNVGSDAAFSITESILADLGSTGDLDGSDVSEYFIVYAVALETTNDASVGSSLELLADAKSSFEVDTNSGTISVNGRVLKNYNASNYKESSAFIMGQLHVNFDDAATLYSADSMKSSLVTVEDIMNGLKKFGDCEDPDLAAEKINELLADAVDVFGTDITSLSQEELFSNMGKILDKMNESEIFGKDVTESMLMAILQSEDVRGELGLNNKEATDFADKLNSTTNSSENVSYGSATQAVSNTIEVVNKINDASTSKEERRESTEKLISNMSPENAELIGTMTTPSMMVKYGAKEDSSDVVASSVTTLMNNMAAFQNKATSDTAYDTEADAVNTLLVLAMDSAASDSDTIFAADDTGAGRTGMSANEFVDLIVSSEVVGETLLTTVYEDGNNDNPYGVYPTDADQEAFSAAVDEYYANNSEGLSEEELDVLEKKLNAVAVIVNMDLPFAE